MAAENADLLDKCLADAGASMRPRRMAAENHDAPRRRGHPHPASMRPRRMAAENLDILADHLRPAVLQ